MDRERDREIVGLIPSRIAPGHHHRDEEEAFDDKTFEDCKHNHMQLGQNVVGSGSSTSFEDILHSLRTITAMYPHIHVKPIGSLRNIVLNPFQLVNVTQRRGYGSTMTALSVQNQNANAQIANLISNKDLQGSLRWLAEKYDWQPVLLWDNMMCDVFPDNLEPLRTLLPKGDIISRILHMIKALKSLNIPIRISIGDRSNTCNGSGLDGSLYFGDFKTHVGDERQEILATTQARFSLTSIAPFVDELTIQYPVDVPGVAGWRMHKRPTEEETKLLVREMRGWRSKCIVQLFQCLKCLHQSVAGTSISNSV